MTSRYLYEGQMRKVSEVCSMLPWLGEDVIRKGLKNGRSTEDRLTSRARGDGTLAAKQCGSAGRLGDISHNRIAQNVRVRVFNEIKRGGTSIIVAIDDTDTVRYAPVGSKRATAMELTQWRMVGTYTTVAESADIADDILDASRVAS